MSIGAIIIGLLLSIYVSRNVLNQLGGDPSEIADGTLAYTFKGNKEGENVGVYHDMEEMAGSVAQASQGIQEVNESAGELSGLSKQLTDMMNQFKV